MGKRCFLAICILLPVQPSSSQEVESEGESHFGAVDETGDAYLIQRPSKYRTKSLDQDVLQNTEKEGL